MAVWNYTELIREILTNDFILSEWKKGLLVKLRKKGDLQNNWSGIPLLSVPSKMFCRVLPNRIEGDIDVRLRQEQTGFQSGKGCTDQIFSSGKSMNRELKGTHRYVLAS